MTHPAYLKAIHKLIDWCHPIYTDGVDEPMHISGEDPEVEVQRSIARNPHTPKAYLQQLSTHWRGTIAGPALDTLKKVEKQK